MTVAVTLKVHEGVVLAADSASTLVQRAPNGSTQVINVYNNANKIANLVKGLPLGVLTFGAGAIGPQSMSSIFKDLRQMFAGHIPGPGGEDWTLDPLTYTVEEAADRVRTYVYDHLYQPAFAGWGDLPFLGMVVAGYSAGEILPIELAIDMGSAGCGPPTPLQPQDECGFSVQGQPEAVMRLVNGFSPQMQVVLEQGLGVPPNEVGPALDIMRQNLGLPLVQDAMPFQDALDLAEFFVDLTIRLTRFMPGPSSVGGPIEVAGITRHEGFKWIKRKHYYASDLNP